MNFRNLHINVKIRLVDVFINSLSTSMYLPFMAIYFSDQIGVKLTGFLMVAVVLISFGIGLYASYFSDLIGRKPIIQVASLVRLSGVVTMTLANLPEKSSTLATFISFLAISVCGGIIEPIAEAMVIDSTTQENRKDVYTFMYWLVNLSTVIGSGIGGFIFSKHLFIILFISSILSLGSFLQILFFIKDVNPLTSEKKRPLQPNVLREVCLHYKRVSTDFTFMIFTLATLLFFTLEFQTSNYIGIRLSKEFHPISLFKLGTYQFTVKGTTMLGLLNVENTLVVVTATLIIGKLIKRFNRFLCLIGGLIIYTGGFFVLGLSNSFILLVIAGFTATIGEILFWPVRQDYLAELIPENARGSYMAVNSFVVRGASVFASLFITIGAFITPVIVSTIYVILGVISIGLFRQSITQIKLKNVGNVLESSN